MLDPEEDRDDTDSLTNYELDLREALDQTTEEEE